MRYVSIANPAPSEGVGFDPKDDLVVPDQGLSIKTILERFTRGEPLSIGKQTFYDDVEDDSDGIDWEKLKSLDLVELDQLRERLNDQIAAVRTGSPAASAPENLDNNMRTDTTPNNQSVTND